MKIIASSLLVLSLLAVQVSEANAVVCARGVYHAGLDNSATGQVLGSVGYNWTPSIATTLGYRVLYTYERDESGPLHDFRYQAWMYGPFAGFKYSF